MTDLATRLAFDTARTSVVTTAALPVPTVASVRLVSSSAGPVLVTSGRTSAGDGGGGTWAWDPTSTDSDDGALSVAVTGVTTGRWKRQYTGPIDVRWFGAVGDGVTDDTAAILAAIAAAASSGGEVLIPAGTFAHASTIAVPDGLTLRGQGTSSVLKYTGAGVAVSVTDAANVAIESLKITSTTGTTGVHVSAGYVVTLSALWVDGTGGGFTAAGIRISESPNNNSAQVHVRKGTHVQACAGSGVLIDDETGAGGVSLHQCRIQGNGGWGFRNAKPVSTSKSQLAVTECDIEGNVLGQVSIEAATASAVENCHIENSDGSTAVPVKLACETGGQVFGLRFTGNFVHAKSATRGINVNWSAAGCFAVDISGNHINNSLSGGASDGAVSAVAIRAGRIANHCLGGFTSKPYEDAGGGAGQPGSIVQTYNAGEDLLEFNATKMGFYDKAAIAQQTIAAVATDPTTTQALANDLRAKLIALGLVKS